MRELSDTMEDEEKSRNGWSEVFATQDGGRCRDGKMGNGASPFGSVRVIRVCMRRMRVEIECHEIWLWEPVRKDFMTS